jgi:hypothetical protein
VTAVIGLKMAMVATAEEPPPRIEEECLQEQQEHQALAPKRS